MLEAKFYGNLPHSPQEYQFCEHIFEFWHKRFRHSAPSKLGRTKGLMSNSNPTPKHSKQLERELCHC